MKKTVKFLVIILMMFFIGVLCTGIIKHLFPLTYSEYVYEYAKEYEKDPYLIFAMIKAESNFDTEAVSHKGAVGLMQFTEKTARWCAEKMGEEHLAGDLHNPENSIKMGCWYLSYLSERFPDMDTALAAYNAGEGTVRTWLADKRYSADGITLLAIPFPETQKYQKRIRIYEKIYRLIYPEK